MKHITATAATILAKMNEQGCSWFTTNQIYRLCPEILQGTLRSQIKRMCDAGLLLRLKKDTYWIIPYEMDSATYMPSWHLLAEPMAASEHYIGFYSALQLHGLITQPSLKEQVVVNRNRNQYTAIVRNTEFQFIKLADERFFGFKRMWIDDYNKALCSDLEKTFVDCLFLPHYAGGIIEIAKALYMAKDKIDFIKLADYVRKFNVGAVSKRLGYLLELLEIPNSIIPHLQKIQTTGIVPLDTEVPRTGKIATRWNLQQNVDIPTIKNAIAS